MKWPWVSRRAYDLLEATNVGLAAQNERLIDGFTRQQRFEAGMSETPKADRAPVKPMPVELMKYIESAWGNASIRRETRNTAYKRNARGTPWPEIMEELMGGDEEADA